MEKQQVKKMVTIKTGHRVEWVDFAKGVCIILVVLLHANGGVEKIMGVQTWLHDFVAWARPFRMPDFFLIAGLFLSRRIDKPWKSYFDTKVVHYAYFYAIWMSVWYVLKLPEYIDARGLESALVLYPLSFVEPLGTLWFIYMLAVFFIVAKLLRKFPVIVVWLIAALLHAVHLETGARVLDEFAARFVFFYSGYVFSSMVFATAEFFAEQKMASLLTGLTIWAVINGWFVFNGFSQAPGIELLLGFVGTVGVVCFGVVLSRIGAGRLIQYCGRNTLPIFLSYFIFMAGLRIVLLSSGLEIGPGIMVVLITAAGVVGPLIFSHLVKNTPLDFVYNRPSVFRLGNKNSAVKREVSAQKRIGENNKSADELKNLGISAGK